MTKKHESQFAIQNTKAHNALNSEQKLIKCFLNEQFGLGVGPSSGAASSNSLLRCRILNSSRFAEHLLTRKVWGWLGASFFSDGSLAQMCVAERARACPWHSWRVLGRQYWASASFLAEIGCLRNVGATVIDNCKFRLVQSHVMNFVPFDFVWELKRSDL